MTNSWPMLIQDNPFDNSAIATTIISHWIKDFDFNSNHFEQITKAYRVPMETVLHSVAGMLFYLGATEKAFDVLHHWLESHHDREIHSLYLRILMTMNGVKKQALFDEILRWNSLYLDKAPQVENHYFTFGSFNGLFKVNDAVLSVWMQILQKIPDSKLVIKAHAATTQLFVNRVLHVSSQYDVAGRVLVSANENVDLMLQAYGTIDLCLNTFPYTAGSTACYALWMGVPTLTLVQKGHAVLGGGVGIFKNLNLDEFIAYSVEEYIEKAVHYANNLPLLKTIRYDMRERLRGSARFDPPRFGKDFGNTCQRVWEDWFEHQQ